MAVFWLILLILCYNMAGDVIAGSPRNLEHDNDEAFAFMTDNLKIEDTTIIPNQSQRNRAKRDTESTCQPGQKYRVVKQPTCLTADSVYIPAFQKCFLLRCYVPGMPDGPKGWNYYAYKHYLYKVYHSLLITRKKRCPKVKQTTTSKPTIPVNLSTKPVRLTTKPTLSSKTVSSAKPPLLSSKASLASRSALVNVSTRPSSTKETDLTTRSTLPRKVTLLSTKLPSLSTKVTLATNSTLQLNKTTKPKLSSTKLPLLSTKTPLASNSTLLNITTSLSTKQKLLLLPKLPLLPTKVNLASKSTLSTKPQKLLSTKSPLSSTKTTQN